MSVNIYNNGHLEKASGNGYSKVDPSLSTLSVNAVQNKVVSEKIEEVESSVSENTAFKNGMLTSIEEITASQNQTTSPVAASAVAQLNQSLAVTNESLNALEIKYIDFTGTTNNYGVIYSSLSRNKKAFCVVLTTSEGVATLFANSNKPNYGVLLMAIDSGAKCIALTGQSISGRIYYFE